MKDKRFFLSWALAIAALVFTYSNHFENPFHFDDDHTIVSNSAIKNWRNIPDYFTDATTTSTLPSNQGYRPLLTTANAVDYKIQDLMRKKISADSTSLAASFERFFCPDWTNLPANQKQIRINPFYFHLSIFSSFLFLGWMIYLLLKKIFDEALSHSYNKYAALAGTVFFWLHTANAETINYIISRSDSLSTCLLMIGMVLFLYLKKPFNLLSSLLFFTAAVFVKEPAIMVVGLLAVYFFFFKYNFSMQDLFNKKSVKPFFSILFSLLPVILISFLFIYFSYRFTPENWNAGGPGMLTYLFSQPFVMAHYFQNFVLPIELSADTDWTFIEGWKDHRIYAGLGFVFIMLYMAWHLSINRITRPITFGILWFFLALLPTSSIVPLAEVLNDHRVFFPYIGLVIAFVWTITLLIYKNQEKLIRNPLIRNLIILLICGIFIAHALGTYQRNKIWSSGLSLWKDVSEKSPKNGRGLMNYGNELMARGDFENAWVQFQKALEIWPNYSYLYINMGVLKSTTGQNAEAETYFKKAIELNKLNPECYFYYAQFLLLQNRIPEAIQLTEEGLKLSPAHTHLLSLQQQLNILDTLSKQNALDAAIKNAANAPSEANFLALSYEFFMSGKYEQSIKAAEEAIKLNPSSDRGWNNICTSYNQLKLWDKAILAGQEAVRLNPTNEHARNNLLLALKGKEGK